MLFQDFELGLLFLQLLERSAVLEGDVERLDGEELAGDLLDIPSVVGDFVGVVLSLQRLVFPQDLASKFRSKGGPIKVVDLVFRDPLALEQPRTDGIELAVHLLQAQAGLDLYLRGIPFFRQEVEFVS